MNKLFFLGLFCLSAFAQNLSQSFPAGKGSNFKLKMLGSDQPIQLSIYVASIRVDSVHIEYYMDSGGPLPVQMWQQFEIGIENNQATKVRRGYVFSKELISPEKLPETYLRGSSGGGVQVNDFLFADKSKLQKLKIGEETVEIAAGTTKTTHYRVERNGQTVDFWVSDQAGPLGLVLLNSKNANLKDQNYSLELVNLVENIRPKILPEKSLPLSEKGKSLLAKPEKETAK